MWVRRLSGVLCGVAAVLGAAPAHAEKPLQRHRLQRTAPADVAPAPDATSETEGSQDDQGNALDDPAAPSSEDPFGDAAHPGEEAWYGWQILAVALPSHVLLWSPAWAETKSPTLPILGLSGIVFGGPIVHWVHGEVGNGFGSLGLNLMAPLTLGGLGALVCSSACAPSSSGVFGDTRALVGFALGAYLGTLTALAVDVSMLAYEPTSDAGVARGTGPWLAITPDFAFDGQRPGGIRLLGKF